MTDVLTLPASTNELIPLDIFLLGVQVTSGVKYAIVAPDVEPSSWTNAEMSGGLPCARVNGLAVGNHTVWAQVTKDTEVAVLTVGRLFIT
jgi:hypothetical protein